MKKKIARYIVGFFSLMFGVYLFVTGLINKEPVGNKIFAIVIILLGILNSIVLNPRLARSVMFLSLIIYGLLMAVSIYILTLSPMLGRIMMLGAILPFGGSLLYFLSKDDGINHDAGN
ncbi:MAG: hypothetical protein WC968_02005 [Bacilli bacterium]|jgi:hypothetical protein